jgi:hypothetical protein
MASAEEPASAPPVLPPASDTTSKPLTIQQTALVKPESRNVNNAQTGTPGANLPVAPVLEVKPDPGTLAPIQGAKLAIASSDPPLVAVLKCVINHEPDKALEYLKGFDAATQDFLLRVFPALARLGQKPLEQQNPEEISILQEQFEGLLETLRPFTRLAISRMCCCRWIKGYGNYEPLPDDHRFHAASKKDARDGEQVTVYVELRNFRCELRDRYHEIRLSSKVELRDARDPPTADPVWCYRFEDRQHPVRRLTQLHDFFNYYTFSVPHLPSGDYILTIQVADETLPERHRVAAKSQEFHVTSMPMAMP